MAGEVTRRRGAAGNSSNGFSADGFPEGDQLSTSNPISTNTLQNGLASKPSEGVSKHDSVHSGDMGPREMLLMALLALQTGGQPVLIKRCVSRDIILTTQVMVCELFKVSISATYLVLDGSIRQVVKAFNPIESIIVAAIPAAIYAVQNSLIQMAYRHVDAVTFSLLNQTKLISTAVFNYLFLGRKQSKQQMGSLLLMLLAAVLLTTGSGSNAKAGDTSSKPPLMSADAFALGILPLLLGSMTSGLGSSYCQWIMQVRGRSAHLFTVEMCFLSFFMLLASCLTSADGAKIRSLGFFYKWTIYSVIPPLTQALGGILVGLVTKYVGGVQKGFTAIFGLIVAALLQFFTEGIPLSPKAVLALPLVILSTYVHTAYPHKQTKVRRE